MDCCSNSPSNQKANLVSVDTDHTNGIKPAQANRCQGVDQFLKITSRSNSRPQTIRCPLVELPPNEKNPAGSDKRYAQADFIPDVISKHQIEWRECGCPVQTRSDESAEYGHRGHGIISVRGRFE
jgi:hypothetical protein